MEVKIEDKVYTAKVVDDGTLDTVISVNGEWYRFDIEYTQHLRDNEGYMTAKGLIFLVEELFYLDLLKT